MTDYSPAILTGLLSHVLYKEKLITKWLPQLEYNISNSRTSCGRLCWNKEIWMLSACMCVSLCVICTERMHTGKCDHMNITKSYVWVITLYVSCRWKITMMWHTANHGLSFFDEKLHCCDTIHDDFFGGDGNSIDVTQFMVYLHSVMENSTDATLLVTYDHSLMENSCNMTLFMIYCHSLMENSCNMTLFMIYCHSLMENSCNMTLFMIYCHSLMENSLIWHYSWYIAILWWKTPVLWHYSWYIAILWLKTPAIWHYSWYIIILWWKTPLM